MYQIPTSLPEPTSTKTKNGKGPYGQVERSVETRWVLNPEAEGVPTVFVRLTTMHSAERKQYWTLMTWGTAEAAKPGSIFSVETWSSSHARANVLTTKVARHSLKAMQAQHEQALADVAAYFAGKPVEIFTEAAEQSGLLVTEEV